TTTTHKTLRGPRGGIIIAEKNFGKFIDKMVFPGIQGGPLMHIIAAKAVAFGEALKPEFKRYQSQIIKNSKKLSEELKKRDFRPVTGGTDNHLILIDLTNSNISGSRAEKILEKVGIVVNKNLIPFDQKDPTTTSGIRLGTPTVTSRGMKEAEMAQIAAWIEEAINNRRNKKIILKIRKEIKKFCYEFPIYKKR
ncbi:MAG: serine hydroxymethyltransferase, partial [Candidatus Omnitrophica bacterium]|nr:serine hydroxymethyltransferase [Candidatus Omnitrophota bacterium]